MRPIIPLQRSVIVACDVLPVSLPSLVEATKDIEGIGGYKVGFRLLVIDGLDRTVQAIRRLTAKPIIFDGQKFGNDIPEIGVNFASDLAMCGVDAVILFPFAGPVTQRIWTEACLKEGLAVIVGGEMTHEGFLASNGGYINNGAPIQIYSTAVQMGIRDFVVPGNKPDRVTYYRHLIQGMLNESGDKQFCFYAPGFISQGGDISETGKVAGESWHAIVGSAIYKKAGEGVDAMHTAAEAIVSKIKVPAQVVA